MQQLQNGGGDFHNFLYVEGTRGSVVGWGRKDTGSFSDGLFNWPNPYTRIMALGSTQPLTEMCTRKYPGVKRGRCVRQKTSPPSFGRLSKKSWSPNLLQPCGPLRPLTGKALHFRFWGLPLKSVNIFLFLLQPTLLTSRVQLAKQGYLQKWKKVWYYYCKKINKQMEHVPRVKLAFSRYLSFSR
jgi:hypothetical protein